ncbi:hypothetical protein PC116_g30179 [Phytophthora cactorum]|nr:hypothetical protein PC116_g30179 [Phytophthora cactorum]
MGWARLGDDDYDPDDVDDMTMTMTMSMKLCIEVAAPSENQATLF